MIKHICLLVIVSSSVVVAQAQRPALHFKFDLGTGAVQKGYIGVTPSALYSEATGYGFEPGTPVKGVDRAGSDALRGDYCTAGGPFYFSVQLPEGNYNVTVTLGDKEGVSRTTIKAECRRLMVPVCVTVKGEITDSRFTVHVRDSLIKGASHGVRLKLRERSYFHWDNKLTLEFSNTAPKVCAIEIEPARDVTTVFLAGNSTVVDQAKEPWAAWGQMIPAFFQPGKVAVANYAESGEALKSFEGAHRLEKILSLMKPGDYLFIEFAHNDQKPGGSHVDPFTSYKAYLKKYIAAARQRGGIPVLVTSMHRRKFDSTGHIVNTLGDYPAAMRQTAREEQVTLIDLNAMSKVLYEAWGPEGSLKAFVHYPAHSYPGQDKPLADDTHFNPYGAWELAKCIVQGIQSSNLALAHDLKKDIPAFDPAHPDAVASFDWPQSKQVEMIKPDGN